MGDIQSAISSIEDGIALLTSMLEDPQTQRVHHGHLLDLRAKARRHLVAIKADVQDFDGARSVLQAAHEQLGARLRAQLEEPNSAQGVFSSN